MRISSPNRIESFDFKSGRNIARKYVVIRRLGIGFEGEVYLIREKRTGIERAAKLFFPHRNPRQKISQRYAKRLHKLRNCPIIVRYHAEENIIFRKQEINILISEYVEGEMFSEFLKRQPGKRLSPFQGLNFLHTLALGLEEVHAVKEYHGDLHCENIIVKRRGIGFDIKLIDLFHWSTPRTENVQDDVCDMIRILYDSLGGQKHYSKQTKEIKEICCGLRRSLILKKFRSTNALIKHLENFSWSSY